VEKKKTEKNLLLNKNHQLIYRSEDGYVDITDLCKAGGKEFKHWNSIKKTEGFLNALSRSVGIPTDLLVKSVKEGINENRKTWAHPQVAINIAQWISPEFDVLVSKWVFEIMLTGKVDLSEPSNTSEDLLKIQQVLMLKDKSLQEKDQLLLSQSKELDKLSASFMASKRKHSYHKFLAGPAFYIISDAGNDKCFCDKKKGVKVGIEGVDINNRLQQHRTTLPTARIDYLIYTQDNELLERCLLRKYRSDLAPFLNHEWIFDVDKEKIIKSAEMILKFLKIDYTVEKDIGKYNKIIESILNPDEVSGGDVLEEKEEKEEKEDVSVPIANEQPKIPGQVMSYVCESCNKPFSAQCSLKIHQKNPMACLKAQGKFVYDKKETPTFSCEYCSRELSTKNRLMGHLNICKTKIKQELQELNDLKKSKPMWKI
jgi:hypothetical protein